MNSIVNHPLIVNSSRKLFFQLPKLVLYFLFQGLLVSISVMLKAAMFELIWLLEKNCLIIANICLLNLYTHISFLEICIFSFFFIGFEVILDLKGNTREGGGLGGDDREKRWHQGFEGREA